MSEPAKPGILDRLRARFGWFDHVMRAYETIDDHIRSSITGALSQQLVDLMNSAINARTSVGVIGLATAAWAGLGWMSHLRAAVTEMWSDQHLDSRGFVRNKISDLIEMVATFAVVMFTLALTALGHEGPMRAVLRWLGIPEFPAFDWFFWLLSILISIFVQWLLFTWMIAWLPRQKVSLINSVKAAFLAAIGFELFKQVASIYLRVVLRSPAGATFGPVLGLMVFSYITAYLVLFATAWAATASGEPAPQPVAPPPPAIIAPRVQLVEGLSTRQTLTAMAVGAVGALTFSRLTRRIR